MRSNLLLLVLAFILGVSCMKNDNSITPVPPLLDSTFTSYDSSYSIRMQVRDDVYIITCDSNNLIRRVLDSVNGTIWAAAYSSNGNLSKVARLFKDSTLYTNTYYTYSYNNANQLIQIDDNDVRGVTNIPVLERITITYNLGLPAKLTRSYSYDGGSIYSYSVEWFYTVADSNITYKLLKDERNNTVYYGVSYQHYGNGNIVKQLALFPDNFQMYELGSLEAYLSKNQVIYSNNSGYISRYNYRYNDKQQLVQFTDNESTPTRQDTLIHTVTFTY